MVYLVTFHWGWLLASFLLGLAGSMGKAYQFYDPMRTRETQHGYYIRDNWQVTRRFSVNIGLRLEHFPIMNRGDFGVEARSAVLAPGTSRWDWN